MGESFLAVSSQPSFVQKEVVHYLADYLNTDE